MTLRASVAEDNVWIRESLGEALRDLRGIETTGVAGSEPGQKVVMLTATANPDVRKRCETLGRDGVFDKSMETNALMDD